VELAKRYSDDDGYRFINGVLRRVVGRGEAYGGEASDGQVSGVSVSEPEVDSPVV
jgi:N utilization substance protein B